MPRRCGLCKKEGHNRKNCENQHYKGEYNYKGERHGKGTYEYKLSKYKKGSTAKDKTIKATLYFDFCFSYPITEREPAVDP